MAQSSYSLLHAKACSVHTNRGWNLFWYWETSNQNLSNPHALIVQLVQRLTQRLHTETHTETAYRGSYRDSYRDLYRDCFPKSQPKCGWEYQRIQKQPSLTDYGLQSRTLQLHRRLGVGTTHHTNTHCKQSTLDPQTANRFSDCQLTVGGQSRTLELHRWLGVGTIHHTNTQQQTGSATANWGLAQDTTAGNASLHSPPFITQLQTHNHLGWEHAAHQPTPASSLSLSHSPLFSE